ncbi:MAG: hypothetical protein WAK31_01175 [Chthoniobacterales bacterium]
MEPPALPNVKGLSSKPRWKSFVCYLPLATIGLQVAWVILLFVALIFAVGDTPYRNTPTNQHLFEFIGTLPAMAGAIFGIIAMVCRWPQNPLDWVCLSGGTLLCFVLAIWLGGFL